MHARTHNFNMRRRNGSKRHFLYFSLSLPLLRSSFGYFKVKVGKSIITKANTFSSGGCKYINYFFFLFLNDFCLHTIFYLLLQFLKTNQVNRPTNHLNIFKLGGHAHHFFPESFVSEIRNHHTFAKTLKIVKFQAKLNDRNVIVKRS